VIRTGNKDEKKICHKICKTITMKITIFTGDFFGNTRIIMTSLARRDVIVKLLIFYKFVTY